MLLHGYQECSTVDEGSTTINDGSTSYTISGLQEGRSYTVNVTATNTAGSAVSEQVIGRTQETSECLIPRVLTEMNNFIYCLLQLHLPLSILSVHLVIPLPASLSSGHLWIVSIVMET